MRGKARAPKYGKRFIERAVNDDPYYFVHDDTAEVTAAAIAQIERDGVLKCVTLGDMRYEGRVV